MPQSSAFFALLFDFAETLSPRVGIPSEILVWRYTPLSKSLGIGESFDPSNEKWSTFMDGLKATTNQAACAHTYYAERIGPDPALGDETFHGHPLFGPFYYEMRGPEIVRPHIAKLQPYTSSFLDPQRRPESRRWLGQMFAHIRATESEARIVLGNSWMYNVAAYRELYPPQFSAELPESEDDEFHYLALWGQFFDRAWRIRPALTERLLHSVALLKDIKQLQQCFPFQVLCPSCPIKPFFDFYRGPA